MSSFAIKMLLLLANSGAGTPPAATTNLIAAPTTTANNHLTWTNNATNATEIRVYRKITGGSYSLIATLAASATSYDDGTISAGIAYTYDVRPYNAAGETSGSAVHTNTLLLSLISYYPANEISAGSAPVTRIDAVTASANDLTDTNNIASTTGKFSLGALLVSASSKRLSHASNASLQTGDIDFWADGWVWFNSFQTNSIVAGKTTNLGVAASTEWVVYYNGGVLSFRVSDGTTLTTKNSSLGVSTGQWYYWAAWHDSVNNTLNIRVNDTVDSVAYSTGVLANSAALTFGGDGNANRWLDGILDEFEFHKRVPVTAELDIRKAAGVDSIFPFGASASLLDSLNSAGAIYWSLQEVSGSTAKTVSPGSAIPNATASGVTTGVSSGIADPPRAYSFPGSGANNVNIHSSALNTNFNRSRGTLSGIFTIPGTWNDGINRHLLELQGASGDEFVLKKFTEGTLEAVIKLGGTTITIEDGSLMELHTRNHIAVTWDKERDEAKLYINGRQIQATFTGLGTPSLGALSSANTVIGAFNTSGSNPFTGTLSMMTIDAYALTAAQVLARATLANVTVPSAPYQYFIGFGDSKTKLGVYQPVLAQALTAANYQSAPWAELFPHNISLGGTDVAYWRTRIDTALALWPSNAPIPAWVLCNFGANDPAGNPLKADWIANYIYGLDAIVTKFSGIKAGIMRPGKQNYDTWMNNFADWIGEIVVARSSFAYLGPNEQAFLKGNDNYASETVDGVHPTTEFYGVTAQQWKTILLAA